MPAPGDLAPMLRRLQAAGTPLEKMRVAARAWRTLRALPQRDRLHLAKQIGIESAEAAIERLADGKLDGRVSSRELLELLEQAERADPHRSRELLAAIRDPIRQRELLRQSAAAVKVQVLTETAPLAGGIAAAPAIAPAQPPPLPPPAPIVPTPEPPPLQPAPQPPVPAPSLAAPAAAWIAAPTVGPLAVPVAALGSDVLSLLDRLREASVVRRMRLLRLEVERLRGMTRDELAAVLEVFPTGWTRRRALAMLLREGVPRSLPDATELIEGLESSTARAWCYAALLERPDLSDAERGAIRARTVAGRRSAGRPAAQDEGGS